MKLALATAAIAATLLSAAPAAAFNQSGLAFFNQCGTGAQAGFFNRPFCHDYVMGFYDALASTGHVCPAIPPNDTQIVIVVQNWMRFHIAHIQEVPATQMIRNAISNAWGCR